MWQDQEPVSEQRHGRKFEIEPLEERIAPSTLITANGLHNETNPGPWVQTGDGTVFLGHDPA